MRRSAILRKPNLTARASVPVFKPKKCKACKSLFVPGRKMQAVCDGVCAVHYGRMQAIKKQQLAALADRRETKAKLKTRADWIKEAQDAFNAFIRKQDEFRGCISCGTNNGKMNAGHYRSVGANPELRFELLNVHKQCERCNTYLHGNLVGYRAGLKGCISESDLDWLEGPHEPKKYTVEDLKAIKAKYRALTKALTAA